MKNKFSDNTLNTDSLPERNQESTEKSKIKLLDVVALTQDVPEHNLKRGEVGTVVEILSNGEAFEVELSDDNGQMYKCLSFLASQLQVIHDEPIKADSKPQVDNQINGKEKISMKKLDQVTMKDCQKLREACLENAEALVNSAKTLEGKSTAHIRYNLAVLALEEIGKAVIFQMNSLGATSDEDNDQQSIATDDHRKKLLWAFFSPFIEYGRIAPEYFESDRELARRMHKRRLETLYTDSQNPLLPHDRMVEEEADSLVRLCEIRIEMEKGVELSDVPDESKLEDLQWFRTASDNQEKRRYFFSEYSLDKLAELGDLFEWMKWHRQEFTKLEEESRELLQQELQKQPIDGIEGNEPKWKVRFRIYSESHSIRQKALNAWNCNSDFIIIKLLSSNNSNELICDLPLPKRVPIRALWNTARSISREFVAALNIATMGLFWWHVDKDRSRFYEKIWDLENGTENDTEVGIDVFPPLNIEWEHQSLTEDDLKYTRHLMGYIHNATRSNPRNREALETYLTGLALMSRIDVHLRLEPNAFIYFFMALKTLLLASGDWDGTEDLKSAAADQFNEFLPATQNLSNYIEWGMQLENRDNPSKQITLKKVIDMKNYCDIYFHLLAERELIRRRNLADSSKE